jgi:hypothetical protein
MDADTAQPSGLEITAEWVEAHLVPILRELSRRGVIIVYDAGVEKTARGSTEEFSIGV